MTEPTERINWDDILKKLASIKALADRGGTLAEAEAASMMMAKLLLRYNLTIMDVEHHAVATRQKVTRQDIKTTSAGWKYRLLQAVARGHFCQAIYLDGSGKCALVGHVHNVIVVNEMYL